MKLYVKIWCPWCIEAIDWLEQRSIPFEQIDVLADAEAYREMRELSGQSLTPTLVLEDGSVLPDFDVGQLEKFLRSHKILT